MIRTRSSPGSSFPIPHGQAVHRSAAPEAGSTAGWNLWRDPVGAGPADEQASGGPQELGGIHQVVGRSGGTEDHSRPALLQRDQGYVVGSSAKECAAGGAGTGSAA